MAVDAARLFDDIVRALSHVLDWHEGEPLLHAWRVGLIAHAVGREYGAADPSLLLHAGLLHDVGAVGWEEHVVTAARRGFPDAAEREHPAAGVRILRPLRALAPALDFVADHHERLDGAGFPAGKRGDAICVGAFVLALADRVELTWREAPPAQREEAVRAMLRDEAGRAWPALLSDAALAVLDAEPGLLALLADPVALGEAVERAGDARRRVEGFEPVELLGQLLWLFSRVVEERHPETLGHAVRVTHHARAIARLLGDDGPSTWDVVFAGLLHDVGLAAIPRAIVAREGALSAEEQAAYRRHVGEGYAVLGAIRDLAHLAGPAAAHHERYDGTGFPLGLAGEQIPLLGRILAFADAYDLLAEGGPGTPALGHAGALAQLRAEVGTRLDPHLAPVALAALAESGRTLQASPDPGELRRLLEEDAPDMRGALSRAAAAASVGGGEPSWRIVEFDGEGVAHRGLDALRTVVGTAEGVRLGDLVDPALVRGLAACEAPGEDRTATVPLVCAGGHTVEAILRRRGPGFELLFRDAGGTARTMERMALFYRNFVASPEASFFADAEGRILDASARFLGLYRYERAALLGRTPPIFDGAGPGFASLLARAHGGADGGWVGEATTVRSDGARIPALVTLSLVRDATGAHVGYAFRLVDLSARLELERELAAKNESLEAVGRLKSELLAIASHDLKAPVAAMMSHARLLRSSLATLPPAAAAGRLELVVRLGQSGLDLIDRMLCLERIEAGTFRLEVVPVRLDALLATCVEGLAPLAQERGVELRLAVPDPVRLSPGDPTRLSQVFNNLVSNAVRYAPPGTAVEAGCRDLGDRLRCEVRDRGPGVAASERERIFERYYQVGGTPGGSGVGLGLHVTRTVVAAHGGRVWVEPRAGGGSTFVVELPADRPELAQSRAVLLDPAGTLAPQLVPLLAAGGAGPIVVRDWIEVARMAASARSELLLAPWREPDLARRAAAAAPACTLVAIREPSDPAAPARLDHALLDTPVLDVEIAAAVQAARRRRDPPAAAPAPPSHPGTPAVGGPA